MPLFSHVVGPKLRANQGQFSFSLSVNLRHPALIDLKFPINPTSPPIDFWPSSYQKRHLIIELGVDVFESAMVSALLIETGLNGVWT